MADEARIQCSALRVSPLMFCVCALGLYSARADEFRLRIDELEDGEKTAEDEISIGRLRILLDELNSPIQYYTEAVRVLVVEAAGLRDAVGRPALAYASHYHLQEQILQLLEAEKDILSTRGRCALHFYATGPGMLFREVFQRLYANFAKQLDNHERNALMAVAATDSPLHVELLELAGAEDADGRCALELAVESGSVNFLRKLFSLRDDASAGTHVQRELAHAHASPLLLSAALPKF